MGIGEPIKFERPGKVGQQTSHTVPPGDVYHSQLHFENVKRIMIILTLFFCAFPFILLSPVIILALIFDWRTGFAMFIIPGITLIPIIIGFSIGMALSYSHFLEAGREDYTIMEEHSIFIHHKPGRRMQSRDLRIPFNAMLKIEMDPEKIERDILDRGKNKMQFLHSTPLPPIGGFYTAFAKTENLVSIKLKEHMQIFQITPGIKWFVIKPEPHWVNEIFINIAVDRKKDFVSRLESRIGG